MLINDCTALDRLLVEWDLNLVVVVHVAEGLEVRLAREAHVEIRGLQLDQAGVAGDVLRVGVAVGRLQAGQAAVRRLRVRQALQLLGTRHGDLRTRGLLQLRAQLLHQRRVVLDLRQHLLVGGSHLAVCVRHRHTLRVHHFFLVGLGRRLFGHYD